ncbi:ATP-dependent protease ATPase subunit HslU [Helicobacter sp. MIT 14-3879]|uniref:ATP-dependent protease ATPase subunit HslU n=1 Tax=Helicobacter sp. MIT 14-3879 TaxID=2040649 RepID=UPI000E1FA35D|nr:ATP-dependent protease ATPase subunit HslU [Helicobacter sp. MIT 14-3879]RDU65459.1 HslU--HslV peptidase ATPase subunit [Helicobacter sp. MIT 14-3879]
MTYKTPKEIVEYLDEYIIGQDKAKKAIAIALRNRFRRIQLPKEVQDEIVPKNILMIGNTGVGKTEISRRMAKILGLPFIKVEASKYTEVGFVGRDVESMVRDLVNASMNLIKSDYRKKNADKIEDYIISKITNSLIPPLPNTASETKKEEYRISSNKMKQKVKDGLVDNLEIEIEVTDAPINPFPIPNIGIVEIFPKQQKTKKIKTSVKEAKELLKNEAIENITNIDELKSEALKRAEESGIIFIDEIDKTASAESSLRQNPNKEGVQRDLLPIVEGSIVDTKYGQIKTDYILFIAAGAFQLSKPSDLIPELQGRFPIRVELDALSEEDLYKILTQTKNSIIKQYILLLGTEGLRLEFDEEALRAIAKFAYIANEKTEDIGARRLHTIVEKVLEDISFKAPEMSGESIIITKKDIEDKLDSIIQSADITRYIL